MALTPSAWFWRSPRTPPPETTRRSARPSARSRATGVRIALDDTGSGSVSFSSLFDVHADIIKIDIEVTHGIASDPMKEAMASALKVLADRLGAMSLAEGIETEEELNLLRGVGVQAGQGYLFGRPEPPAD